MNARIPRIVATILAITFSTTLFSQDFILNNRTIVKTGEDYTTTDGGTTFKVLGNEVVVKYANATSDLEKASLENTLGLTKLREASTGFIDYRLGESSDYFSTLQALESSPLVEIVEVAMEGFYVLDPNDPLFPQQWYLQQANDADIDAPEAFDITMGSNRVVVAILDSGTDWTHEDIGMGPDAYQNVFLNPGEDAWADPNDPATGNGIDDDGNGLVDDWKGWDFVNNNNDSRGPFFHGTHVAGIVSAKSNNNLGMASVAGGNNSPGVQMLPDITNQYDVLETAATFTGTGYHELGHASHHELVGEPYWRKYRNHIINNGGYGSFGNFANNSHTGHVALGEAIGNFTGALYGGTPGGGENFEWEDNFIPRGLMWDLGDNTPWDTVTDPNEATITGPDNISGFTPNMIFNGLTPDVNSIRGFRDRLRVLHLSDTPNSAAAYNTFVDIYDVFN